MLEIWLLASLTLFLLTATSFLWFLGEAERYLEYAILPAILLFVLHTSDTLFFILLAYGVIIYILSIVQFHGMYLGIQSHFRSTKDFFNQFNSDFPTGTILPVGKFWEISYFTKFPILTYGGNIKLSEYGPDFFKRLWKDLDFDLLALMNQYNIKYVIVESGKVDDFLKKQKSDFIDLEKVLISERFEVFMVQRVKQSQQK